MYEFYFTKNAKNIVTLYIKDLISYNTVTSSQVKIGKVTKFKPFNPTEDCTSFHLYDKNGTTLLLIIAMEL